MGRPGKLCRDPRNIFARYKNQKLSPNKYLNSFLYITHPAFSGNAKSGYPVSNPKYPTAFPSTLHRPLRTPIAGALRTLYLFCVPYSWLPYSGVRKRPSFLRTLYLLPEYPISLTKDKFASGSMAEWQSRGKMRIKIYRNYINYLQNPGSEIRVPCTEYPIADPDYMYPVAAFKDFLRTLHLLPEYPVAGLQKRVFFMYPVAPLSAYPIPGPFPSTL